MSSWSNDPAHVRAISAHELGPECVHCHRRCGNLAGGYASFDGAALCSRPTVAGRPDCYANVVRNGHPLRHCGDCIDPDPAPLPVHVKPFGKRSKSGLTLHT